MTSRLVEEEPFYRADEPADALHLRLKHIANLPADRRRDEALRILWLELDLPRPESRERVAKRLRTLLLLDNDELPIVTAAFLDATKELELDAAAELAELEEGAILDGMTFLECRKLARFLPAAQSVQPDIPWRADRPVLPHPVAAGLALAS